MKAGLKALGLKKYASERHEALKEDAEMTDFKADQEKADLSEQLIKNNATLFQTSLIQFWNNKSVQLKDALTKKHKLKDLTQKQFDEA